MSSFHMKFSAIAHRGFRYCNPVSTAKMDRLIALLDLGANARTLDVGCGKAELLIRLAEAYGTAGVGVDQNAAFLAEAQSQIAVRAPDMVTLLQADGADYTPDEPFDLSVCMGARPFGETYESTLLGLKQRTRPGGLILVGEGYWIQTPSEAAVEFLGGDESDQATHAQNVAIAAGLDLTPLYSCVASQDDWDHYEGLYLWGVERYCQAHPEDEDTPRMRERIHAWHRAVLTILRGTLGFGLYLFRT